MRVLEVSGIITLGKRLKTSSGRHLLDNSGKVAFNDNPEYWYRSRVSMIIPGIYIIGDR